MAPSMKYWDDWVDPTDMRAMWSYPEVYNEWTAAGETEGHKVHMSRNPDGQPYVTQTEMKAMAVIINNRHFNGMLDSEMICAIAEIESDRQPLAYRYEPKLGEASTGLMQTLQSTAEWLAKDMGYRAYTVDWTTSMLYKPFVSIYFGAAYLRWLSTYDGKLRNEEFMVRAYSGGPKKAAKRSTQEYWNKYLIAKQCISFLVPAKGITAKACSLPGEMDKNGQIFSSGKKWWYWEDKVHEEDMIEMRKHLDVKKEWIKAGEKDGKIRFARDSKLRPYLTRAELKAVAEITISRHFKEKNANLVMLCALAEVSSGRLVHGRDPPGGVMGIPFKIAEWLYSECGCKFYKVKSLEDLSRPFISMYFAACYVCWLSSYEGRQRSEQFIVHAYCSGPHAINTQEARLFWLKYLDAVSVYQAKQRNQHGSCSIQ